ncbi:hypothetical protein [Xanthomarina sp. F2636L]|uniref:hypothetical protein n=1 Tax=Xanthomarina sp. F2636L TaxID=2996018 RepID=UPI00225DFF61|nr:hypothetical protein [Xanthomarina sp. F2636L]MCX7551393.1 hypothetical protein [Xanthomarina sp. F2636L]
MKKLYSLTTIHIMLISLNAHTTNYNETVASKLELLAFEPEQSCFSFYHDLFNEYYGGVNIGNVGDFNGLVANCQALFE